MKNILIISILSILAACSPLKPRIEEHTVVKVEYITKLPPSETLKIPEAVPLPPVNEKGEMMQSDIAEWVLKTEKRIRELENKIIGIGKFYYQDNN